jgi:hypothetical protein
MNLYRLILSFCGDLDPPPRCRNAFRSGGEKLIWTGWRGIARPRYFFWQRRDFKRVGRGLELKEGAGGQGFRTLRKRNVGENPEGRHET